MISQRAFAHHCHGIWRNDAANLLFQAVVWKGEKRTSNCFGEGNNAFFMS